MAQKQGQNQGDVIRSFTLGNKELEGKTVEFQYDRGQYSITDVVGEERSIVYKSRNAQEAYTRWNVYIGRKKERPERPERQERNGEERSAEDKQGRARDNARDEKRAERENNRGERDNSRQERTNNRGERDTSRQERGSNRSERDNNRGRSRANYRNNEPHAERNEDRSTDRAAGNGGYNQGFTAASAESGAGEKRYRRPRRRRNDHREQES